MLCAGSKTLLRHSSTESSAKEISYNYNGWKLGCINGGRAHQWGPGREGGGRHASMGAGARQWWPEPVGEPPDMSVRARGHGLGVGTCERGGGDVWVVAGMHGSAPGRV